MGEEGRVDKRDEGKAPLSLLACVWEELGDVARVLAFGNQKYKSIWNYRTIEKGRERYIDAALRHIYASAAGELQDGESKVAHLAHGACDLLMALWFEKHQPVEAVRAQGIWRELATAVKTNSSWNMRAEAVPAEEPVRDWEIWIRSSMGMKYDRQASTYPLRYTEAEAQVCLRDGNQGLMHAYYMRRATPCGAV